jgi:hypothetical protein
MSTWHVGAVPLQLPSQLENVPPPDAVAVSVTVVPSGKSKSHAGVPNGESRLANVQSIPAGVETILPVL